MFCLCVYFSPFPLTLFFSRLLQACPGAVWKAVHDAQEHAKALREHRQLFCLWPPLSQCGGFLWRTGQLPHPLHGEYRVSTLCACTWKVSCLLFLQSRHTRAHTHGQTEATTHTRTLFCTYFDLLTHIGCHWTVFWPCLSLYSLGVSPNTQECNCACFLCEFLPYVPFKS